MDNRYKKYFLISGILIVFSFIFFKFKPIFPPDGADYYSYIFIFKGIFPMSVWHIVRGPGFPIVIYLITTFFGESINGILLGLLLLNILLLFSGYSLLSKLIKEENLQKHEKYIWLSYIALVVFNPLIIGYSHTILTESVAPAIIMLTFLISYKWFKISFYENKIKYIIYTIFFGLICTFMWFLKQPYTPVILFILAIMSLFSIIVNKHKILDAVQRLSSIMICIFFILGGILLWNKILEVNNVPIVKDKTSESFLASGLLGGIQGNFKKSEEFICEKTYIMNHVSVITATKTKMLEILENDGNCQKFILFNVFSRDNKIVAQTTLFKNSYEVTSFEALKFVFQQFIKRPFLVIDSYYKNYMATINLFPTYINFQNYSTEKELVDINNENDSLGLVTYKYVPIYWWGYGTEEEKLEYKEKVDYIKYMKQYEEWTDENNNYAKIAKIISPVYLVLFKIVYFLAPIIAVYSFIQFLRNKYNKLYMIQASLFATTFLHTLFHAATGAIIDRYAYVTFPIALIGIILLFIKKEKFKNELEVINEMRKEVKKEYLLNKKVLFVIPAYNEEANIEKVIKEIKADIPKSDILVINDCSKDNTAKIAEKSGAKVITNPINLKYAMALQTGFKYALKNNYDYVIQFDGDGQHIASEALKLLNKIQKSNADIVIGSRFLKKTDYKHPFFRKIGTNIFSFMIKSFCKKKITDPTSGMQCLNRNMIIKFSQIGNFPEFPDANLIMDLLFEGYKIEEVSVQMRLNEQGTSMHGGIIKPIKYMINVFYSIIFILIKQIGRGK